MADNEEQIETESDDNSSPKKSKKKLLILIILLIIILGGGAGTAFHFGIFEEKQEISDEYTQTEDGELIDADGKVVTVGADGLIEEPVFYDIQEFVVNLNVGSKQPSFLKMTLSLELPGESQIEGVEKDMPRIRDSFQVYLRELRKDDLQGSAGMYRLREELLLRINKIVYPAKVNDILFKEILVQ